jgi:NADPH:quinone reductase-like Zn-dependent oxidoreductase
MRAVVLEAFGSVEGLSDAELPIPSYSPDELLIRVKAVGFNPLDFQLRHAGFERIAAPLTLGFDVAGIVEKVGAAVTQFRPGEEVMAWLGGPSLAGGYAEYVATPAAFVARKPSGLTFTEAASVPLASLTALQSLRRAGLDRDKTVFVAGGAGGVGSWAILLAQMIGNLTLVTTAGRDESTAYLVNELRVQDRHVVRYSDADRNTLTQAALRANQGKCYDITLDCVGGAMTSLCCDVVDFEGIVVSIVKAPKDNSHPPAEADEEALFRKSAAFHFELVFALAEYAPKEHHQRYSRELEWVGSMLESGALRLPRISNVGELSADTVKKAHRLLEGGRTIGKLVASV